MAPDVEPIHPDRTFIVDSAKAGDQAISGRYLIGGLNIANASLVPHYFVSFIETNAGGRGLESVGDLNLALGLCIFSFGRDALNVPLLSKAGITVVEDEGPSPIERSPVQSLTQEVWAGVGSHRGCSGEKEEKGST